MINATITVPQEHKDEAIKLFVLALRTRFFELNEKNISEGATDANGLTTVSIGEIKHEKFKTASEAEPTE